MNTPRALGALALACLLGGCYGLGNGRVPMGREQNLLGWSPAEGLTSQEEVIARYGEPSETFEDGRILTYRFVTNASGKLEPTSAPWWPPLSYNLILVFDSCGSLVRHSFLRIK